MSQTQPKRRRPGVGFVLVNAAALALASLIAVSPLWPVYESAAFLVLVGSATALGIVIATLGAVFRWPSYVVLLATVGSYLVAGVPLAVPSMAAGILPSADGFVELVRGTALSWKQLLTIVLPVGSYQTLLVPPLVLVLGTVTIGMSIALRARFGELAVLAPIVLFVAGILLGPAAVSAPFEIGLGLLVVVLFWLLWFRWQRRRAAVRLVSQRSTRVIESAADRRIATARTLVGATVVVAVAAAAGTAATLALPASAPRNVARSHVQQPFDPRDYPSPLAGFRGNLRPGSADARMLTVSGLPEGGRIRVATLDSYDGVVYSVGSDRVSSASGSFTRLPYRLDQSGVDGTETTIEVTIEGYRGVWVPGTGQLERIEFTSDDASRLSDVFFYNDNSGTAAVLGGLRQGDRYRAESVVPAAVDDLSALRPGTAVLPPIGVLPDGLRQTLDRWTEADAPEGRRLAEMLDGLATEGYVSHGIVEHEPFSRSGHAADRITQLLTDKPMLGDAEQYAVVTALMARELGFPARVVVGYVPPASSSRGVVAVLGSDVSAWIEVQDSRGRWITIDPNPEPRAIPEKQPNEPTVVSRPQTVLPPPAEDTPRDPNLMPPESTPEDPLETVDPLLLLLLAIARLAGWTVLGMAILVSPFLGIIAAKMRRRRLRRTAGSPVQRIAGGWREFADSATDHGVRLPPSATRSETAVAMGGMPPLVLASAVDRAVFAPGEPSAEDAEQVWEAVDELRGLLGANRSRRQRILALVSLRSFGRYAVKKRGDRS
ncbi:transglutaminase domain-containing protein [Luethyella okanaganae]|uniref:Transglutaminase domain-containing protein n=1 Tax=Luethyella okanaganae TaxID=69372 RepID=A0ABW1VHF5_9MICO